MAYVRADTRRHIAPPSRHRSAFVREVVNMQYKHKISAVIILAILLVCILSVLCNASASPASEDATIWGYVYDQHNGRYVENVTIEVEREHYLGNRTKTDSSGYYEMRIPSGHYTLYVWGEQGYLIYSMQFNISSRDVLRLDFTLQTNNIRQSKIFGTLRHSFILTPMRNADVRLSGLSSKDRYQTLSDENGYYELTVPAGSYILEFWVEGTRVHNESIRLNYKEVIEISLYLTAPSHEFTAGNLAVFLKNNWQYLILIAVIFIAGFAAFLGIDRLFERLLYRMNEKSWKFVDERILFFIRRVLRWNVDILIAIGLAFIAAKLLDIEATLWVPIANSITSIYLVILLIIALRISLMVWRLFIGYIKTSRFRGKATDETTTSRFIAILDFTGKYLIITIYLVIIAIIILAAIGLKDWLVQSALDFFSAKAGFIIFIVILLVIAYFAVRFIADFFNDMKVKTKRFRPEMLDLASSGVKYAIYGIIAMIISYTILSAAGLGEIGQTMILVFSLIIGMVVSMAATGSIGNILSGIVLMAFKPIEEGDWVKIADKYTGQVVESNLLLTKLRNMENEIIEIPNNIILSAGIINLSTAKKHGYFAMNIEASIGYDVPARKVIRLMTESAKNVPGVLKDPAPVVITTEFQNHAINYLLRAYVDNPAERFNIKTEIMIEMQKRFTEEGVEILSPIYRVERSEKVPTAEQVRARLPDIVKEEKTNCHL